jgi:hypothetical protein
VASAYSLRFPVAFTCFLVQREPDSGHCASRDDRFGNSHNFRPENVETYNNAAAVYNKPNNNKRNHVPCRPLCSPRINHYGPHLPPRHGRCRRLLLLLLHLL